MAASTTQNGAENEALREPLLSSPENNNDNSQGQQAGGTSVDIPINKDVVFPKWVTPWRDRSLPPARLNHNVALTLLLDVCYGISDSLWSGTVIAAYLKALGGGKNSLVGDIEAVNGLAVLLSAIPVGYAADKLGRSKIIAAGGALFIITAAAHAWILWWIGDDPTQMVGQKREIAYVMLGVIMALWGIGGGVVSGPAQALYADSTPAGERSKYYMYLFAAYILSTCMGPLLSIILFQTIGDDWDIYDLRIIIFVGLGLEVFNAFLMMLFDDKKALDEEEDEPTDESNDQQASGEQNGTDTDDTETVPLVSTDGSEAGNNKNNGPNSSCDVEVQQNGSSTNNNNSNDTDNTAEAGEDDPAAAAANESLNKRRKWIPYILFMSSLVVSLGSGMTVKFFPLFFKDDVGMSPTQVQIIYLIVPIAMVIVSSFITKLAAVIGRVQATILSMVIGLSCLYSMVFFRFFLDKHPFALVPVYIVRTAFMNSSYPLQESILMDFVPKDQRARWKSLESVSVFGWCGSAAFGAWLADARDYNATFFLTAVIQSISVFLFALLLPLVPRKESDAPGANAGVTESTNDETEE